MSKKTSIPPKRIKGDHGIQSYRSCDEGYVESVERKTTFKKATDEVGDAIIIRESEFAVPYDEESEDFSDMEYDAPRWPSFDFDFPGMTDPKEFYDPWHITFFCDVDACWCEDQKMAFVAVCSWEIVDAYFDPPKPGLKVTASKNIIFIHASSAVRGCGDLTIEMRAPTPKGGGLWQGKYRLVPGTHSGIQVCECDEDECLECDDSEIAWDYVNSAHTIDQDDSVDVYITDDLGTGGPYTWSVEGGCFNLDEAETVGLQNTLNSDADACGPAVITVTGCDGTEITGTVRCTEGEWVHKTPFQCPIPGPFSNDLGYDYFDRIEGLYKVEQFFDICEITTTRGCYQWEALYAPDDPCDTVVGNTCDSWESCIDFDNSLCDALSNYTGSVACPPLDATHWKCTWPTKSDCAEENPPDVGCVCYDIGDHDYYEWECPYGQSCD